MTMAADKRKGILFIISAPSGAGKTSLVRALLETVPDLYVSVSHTTRPPRPHETPGADYYFVSEAEFQVMVGQNRFLEHAKVFEHCYGTSKSRVETRLADGKDVILEIDWQGARQVCERMRDAVSIFILPPSLSSLEERLRGRGDREPNIRRRLRDAAGEIRHCREYDYLIVNDDFDRTLEELAAILTAVRRKAHRPREDYEELIRELLHQGENIR